MELTNQISEQMYVIRTKQGKKLKGLSQIGLDKSREIF